MRGSPHAHCLTCVKRTDNIERKDLTSDDPVIVSRLHDMIKKTVTAILPPDPDRKTELEISEMSVDERNKYEGDTKLEEGYEYEFDKNLFTDDEDPRRVPFNPKWDFSRNSDGTFNDPIVHKQYRNLLLANNLHVCTPSCWKYNTSGGKICRYGYPKDIELCSNEVSIVRDRDRKSRKRITVHPPRNHSKLNATSFNPLDVIAHGGNSDKQFIGNEVGAAEYVASYSCKPEAPDAKIMRNLFTRKLAQTLEYTLSTTDRQKLQAAALSVIGSTTYGTVQACYILLGLDLVISSRTVVTTNPLHRKIKFHIMTHYVMYIKLYKITHYNRFSASQNIVHGFQRLGHYG